MEKRLLPLNNQTLFHKIKMLYAAEFCAFWEKKNKKINVTHHDSLDPLATSLFPVFSVLLLRTLIFFFNKRCLHCPQTSSYLFLHLLIINVIMQATLLIY